LTTDYIKVDKSRPTGTVEVNINDNNQPDYIIKKDVPTSALFPLFKDKAIIK
jgi:hypothetical protein